MILSSLENRLRFRTHVTTLEIKYVLETGLRACIQRGISHAMCSDIHSLHESNEMLRIPCFTLFEAELNRDPVVWDQKLLPEVQYKIVVFQLLSLAKFFPNLARMLHLQLHTRTFLVSGIS